MGDCPFLSTYDNRVECFSECPFNNWKENGGLCPFKNLRECNPEIIDDSDDLNPMDDELKYVRNSYDETRKENC